MLEYCLGTIVCLFITIYSFILRSHHRSDITLKNYTKLCIFSIIITLCYATLFIYKSGIWNTIASFIFI